MEKYMTKSIFISLIILTVVSTITACSSIMNKPVSSSNPYKGYSFTTTDVQVGKAEESSNIVAVEVIPPAGKKFITMRCEIVE